MKWFSAGGVNPKPADIILKRVKHTVKSGHHLMSVVLDNIEMEKSKRMFLQLLDVEG